MPRIDVRALIIPVGQRNASERFTVKWDRKQRADLAKQIRKAVEPWAKRKYLGRTVVLDLTGFNDLKVDGVGVLFIDGVKFAEITTFIPLPEPVPAESLFGGGL